MQDTVVNISEKQVWTSLNNVYDPEIPVVSIIDLGIVRGLKINGQDIEVFSLHPLTADALQWM